MTITNRKMLNFTQQAAIAQLIGEHAVFDNGYVLYEDGWSDARVLVELNEAIWGLYPRASRAKAVSNFRRREMGKTRIPNAKASPPEPQAGLSGPQLAAVERMIADLRHDVVERLGKLERRVQAVETPELLRGGLGQALRG